MYQDAVFGHKTMGDVDLVFVEGVYHLFHLVLPNHDFIAHAVSRDGLNWRRVENALFIGHPGSWDDHMLWTVHVSRDPWQAGRWRMFYTGISREDHGRIQRVGCAYSHDLVRWEKAPQSWAEPTTSGDRVRTPEVSAPYDEQSPFPLAAAPPHYESTLDEGRSWVSFRDPFYFHEAKQGPARGTGHLLTAARTASGPVIRRGCVAAFEETGPNEFTLRPPLHHPGHYDDVEVPNLFCLDNRYFLVGSIREDAKVRYWTSESLDGPWANYFDNVLLPAGNYAARVSFDDRGPLVWNFFTSQTDRTVKNLMPPPKRLAVREDGRLTLHSFEAFDQLITSSCGTDELRPVSRLTDRWETCGTVDVADGGMTLTSDAGFEGFLFSPHVESFRFHAQIHLDGLGKCGLLIRIDPETSSGYFLSLDLLKGVAQLRAWGVNPGGEEEHAFRFKSLQSGYWQSNSGPWSITMIGLGNYLEFSIDGHVLLTLSDDAYQDGLLGVYVESACVRLENVRLEHLEPPTMPTDHLPTGEQP